VFLSPVLLSHLYVTVVCFFFLRQSRCASQLTELGGKCRGERHLEVIERQREAISELRGSLSELVKTLRNSSIEVTGRRAFAAV